MSLKNEVIDCKQDPGEPIAKYSFRLSEKAKIAYKDQQKADDNAFIAFMKGVRDSTIRRKLKESSSIIDFKGAVAYAKKLESISKQFGVGELQLASILRETEVSFSDTRENHGDTKMQEEKRIHLKEGMINDHQISTTGHTTKKVETSAV